MKIYKIKNTINNKVYIGQTISVGDIRWLSHRSKLRKGKHPNVHLQSSWDKWGENCFSYEVITESCLGLLDSLEIFYIAKFNSSDNKFGYNKDKGGHLSKIRKPVSEETRKKISIANTGKKHPHSEETKVKLSIISKGRVPKNKGIPNGKKGIPTGYIPSKETRLKMSKSHTGKKRPPVTEQAKKNISEAAKLGWVKRKANKVVKDV